jgi:phosphatidate cytidylyltransferase
VSNFIQRIITASVLIPLVLFAVFYIPHQYFALFLLLISMVGVFEFTKINNLHNTNGYFVSLVLVGVVILFLLNPYINLLPFFITISLWWMLNAFVVITYPFNNTFINYQGFKVVNAILLFLPFVLGVITLQQQPYILLLLLLIVISADSFAYISGKLFGKHKLAPNLSGGKTIEGVVGGVLFAVIFAGIYVYFVLQESVEYWIGIAFVTALFSVFGDLYQSAYKRVAGVKDSGNILPGHGGIWDRIDGFLAATPVFMLGVML